VNCIQFIMQKILKIHHLPHLCSKKYEIIEGFPKIERATQFPRFFFNFLSFLNFQWPNFSIFIDLNFVKPPQCTPYSSRAFQRYWEHDKGALWFGGPQHDKTKQTKPNQTTFVNRRWMSILHNFTISNTHITNPNFTWVFTFFPFYCCIKAV